MAELDELLTIIEDVIKRRPQEVLRTEEMIPDKRVGARTCGCAKEIEVQVLRLPGGVGIAVEESAFREPPWSDDFVSGWRWEDRIDAWLFIDGSEWNMQCVTRSRARDVFEQVPMFEFHEVIAARLKSCLEVGDVR